MMKRFLTVAVELRGEGGGGELLYLAPEHRAGVSLRLKTEADPPSETLLFKMKPIASAVHRLQNLSDSAC
jgi:hypothetical protein